jgi:hypothetical protein
MKALSYYLTLLGLAIGGPPSDVQSLANGAHSSDQHYVALSGGDYEEIAIGMTKLPKLAGSSGQALLTAMETWVSSQFDLPAIHEHPRIEFAPPAKIASLRFADSLSDPEAEGKPSNRASSAQHDTIAIYYDATRTIYLPEGWTGGTPAELSVLVHEVVHHFQNVLGLKHECPQEREKLAYLVQQRWLGLFGHSLESDFDLDPLSLLVKTRCFY